MGFLQLLNNNKIKKKNKKKYEENYAHKCYESGDQQSFEIHKKFLKQKQKKKQKENKEVKDGKTINVQGTGL